MGIFTSAELDEQITAFKAALLAVSKGKSFRMNTGGSDRTWTSEDLPEIRATLQWLANEKSALLGTAVPVTVIGRPAR